MVAWSTRLANLLLLKVRLGHASGVRLDGSRVFATRLGRRRQRSPTRHPMKKAPYHPVVIRTPTMVARLMGPGAGVFARLMGPPNRQGHGATGPGT